MKGKAPPDFTLGYVRGGGFEVSDTVGGIYIIRVALAYQNGDIGRMPMRDLINDFTHARRDEEPEVKEVETEGLKVETRS